MVWLHVSLQEWLGCNRTDEPAVQPLAKVPLHLFLTEAVATLICCWNGLPISINASAGQLPLPIVRSVERQILRPLGRAFKRLLGILLASDGDWLLAMRCGGLPLNSSFVRINPVNKTSPLNRTVSKESLSSQIDRRTGNTAPGDAL